MNLFLIFSLSLTIINSKETSYCGSFLPRDGNSCYEYSTEETYCCYLTNYSNSFYNNMCYPIYKTDYQNLNNNINLNGYDFNLNCGVRLGTTCGDIINPKSYFDCSQFSTGSNTCCYYQFKEKTNCVWLDSANMGKLEYKGLSIICSSEWMRFKIFSLLLFVFMLLY